MSYNTRRTGTGTGRGTTTQVNYHQQPTRPGGTASTPSRNPTGYTTQQQTPAYNSAAQPAFTTQPAYTTTPPLPKAPPQPTVQAPPVPAQAPKPPTTPSAAVKQEPLTPHDTPKMDTQENGDGSQSSTPKQFWKRKPFPKLSNKVKKARQNAKLRRILNPKNALTFLNELKPGAAKFTIREEPGWGFVASCELEGKTFSGYGSTVSKGKVQASEQALKHLLLEQLSKSQAAAASTEVKEEKGSPNDTTRNRQTQRESLCLALKSCYLADEVAEAAEEEMETDDKQEGSEPRAKRPKIQHAEDDVPWGSLAAFALHKLFAEWQKEGAADVEPQEKYDEEMIEEVYYKRPTPDFYPPSGGPRVGGFGPGPRGSFPPPSRGRGFVPFPGPRGPPQGAFGMSRRAPIPPSRQAPIIPSLTSGKRFKRNKGYSAPALAWIAQLHEEGLLSSTRRLAPENENLSTVSSVFNVQPMKKIPEDAGQRHPVMLLNQLKPNVVYNERREGAPGHVIFAITVTIDGKEYTGKGKNKKEAKKSAAMAALAPLGIKFEESATAVEAK